MPNKLQNPNINLSLTEKHNLRVQFIINDIQKKSFIKRGNYEFVLDELRSYKHIRYKCVISINNEMFKQKNSQVINMRGLELIFANDKINIKVKDWFKTIKKRQNFYEKIYRFDGGFVRIILRLPREIFDKIDIPKNKRKKTNNNKSKTQKPKIYYGGTFSSK